MLYTRPDYYKEFTCAAEQCEDTCCAGWQIVIDEDALEKYREKLSGKKDDRIDWEEGVFCQSGEKRCTFLNDRNLCDMYIEWGEEYLCETCRRYILRNLKISGNIPYRFPARKRHKSFSETGKK